MKNLKLPFLILVFLGGMLMANAQRAVVKVYPKHGTVVAKISKPRIVVHKRTNFYVADGVWYKARGKKYVVCAAPRGVKVRTLPRGNKVVVVNGRKLYKYKGIYYKRSKRHYTVVNI